MIFKKTNVKVYNKKLTIENRGQPTTQRDQKHNLTVMPPYRRETYGNNVLTYVLNYDNYNVQIQVTETKERRKMTLNITLVIIPHV